MDFGIALPTAASTVTRAANAYACALTCRGKRNDSGSLTEIMKSIKPTPMRRPSVGQASLMATSEPFRSLRPR